MKITVKQLMVLFETTMETLSLDDGGNMFSFNYEDRRRVVEEMINQQGDVLIDIYNEEKSN